MSDDWLVYPSELNDHVALTLFDHGACETVDAAPGNLLQVRLAIRQPDENGMPGDDEVELLAAFEDRLAEVAEQAGAMYVGRVTTQGHQHYFVYTGQSDDEWAMVLDALAAEVGYDLEHSVEADEEHSGYWDTLFPSEDDWQVIQDLQVTTELEEAGDDGSTEREIEHWAYFPTAEAAATYSQWLRDEGYTIADEQPEPDTESVGVRFTHVGPARIPDITTRTLLLRREAEELGGDYDGWETHICGVAD